MTTVPTTEVDLYRVVAATVPTTELYLYRVVTATVPTMEVDLYRAVLSQVWCLIVSIPDLDTITYFYSD